MTIHEAKTNFSKLVRRAEAGEEIVVRRGREPVARIVPLGRRSEWGRDGSRLDEGRDLDGLRRGDEGGRHRDRADVRGKRDLSGRKLGCRLSLRLLVDSHVLLWHVLDDPRLGPAPTAAIEADDAEVLISIASLWEIAIKSALGKLAAPQDFPEKVEQLGFEWLPVRAEHAWRVRDLPHHHRDPFDRLLIAQALVEGMPILTADPSFALYDAKVVWG